MRTKSFQRLALVAGITAAVLGIAGCSSAGSSGPQTITVVGTSDTQVAITDLVKAFEKANPKVTVKTTFTQTGSYVSQEPRVLAGSRSPDVAIVFPGPSTSMQAIGLLQKKLIVDQSSYPYAKSLTPAQKVLLGENGQVGYNPLGYDTIGLIYNKSVFDQNGLKPFTTWGDLLGACKTLSAKGVTPISLGIKDGFPTLFIAFALAASTVYQSDPTFDAKQLAGKATFASGGWGTVFDKELAMKQAGCFSAGLAGETYVSQMDDVATGKAAMSLTVGPSFATIRKSNPTGTFAMFPVPAFDQASKNGAPQALSVGFGISARSKSPAAAKSFVDFANSAKNAATFAKDLGVNSLAKSAEPLEGFADQVALIRTGRVGTFSNQFWPNASVGDTFYAVSQELLGGQISSSEAVKQLDASYSSALASK